MLWHLIIHLVKDLIGKQSPWFDANGLNDVAPMQEVSVLQKLQGVKMKSFQQFNEETKEEKKLKQSLDPLKELGKDFKDKSREIC